TAPIANAILTVRNTATGIVGVSSDCPSGNAVLGVSQNGNGVFGKSPGGLGVAGQSTSGDGGFGSSESGVGGRGKSISSDGVSGEGSRNGVSGVGIGSGSGVAGVATGGVGIYGHSDFYYAGYFTGDVHVLGTLSAGGKNFKFDHPLDPTNKTLAHSVVESPD